MSKIYNNSLCDKFIGAMLGCLIGDVIGAVIEGKDTKYIIENFSSVEDILTLKHVELVPGQKWTVGRFTDDTAMTIDVAEWLIEDMSLDDLSLNGKNLLAKFNISCREGQGRRCGPGVAIILNAFEEGLDWKNLSTLMYADGSYGNGSAMRVGPIGCLYYHYTKLSELVEAVKISSITTHSHDLAIQGAILQASAVAQAISGIETPLKFIDNLSDIIAITCGVDSIYNTKLKQIKEGIIYHKKPIEMIDILGNGIEAHKSVPMAIYCFLSNWQSFENVVEWAILVGGDTDTIASMAATISGAFHGYKAIPISWLDRVKEEEYTVDKIKYLSKLLYEQYIKINKKFGVIN